MTESKIAPLQASTEAAMVSAKAEVEARFIAAERHPRSWDDVRARALAEAARPSFAAGAIYRVPVGNGQIAEGLSIRAAEALHRISGNLLVTRQLAHADAEREVWRVTAIDLETNSGESEEIPVPRLVERRRLKEGQRPVGHRRNAAGETVYLVEADETTMRRKRRGEQARAKRNCILPLIPADIREDFTAAIRSTNARSTQEDPAAARKAIQDAFAGLGVEPSELGAYVGKPLAQLLPLDLVELRSLYVAIRDGHTSWPAAVARRRKATAGDADAPEPGDASDVLDQVADAISSEDAP